MFICEKLHFVFKYLLSSYFHYSFGIYYIKHVFISDDNTANSNFLEANAIKDSEIVDGIVQERIDEISKDKHSGSPNEANTNISSKAKVE